MGKIFLKVFIGIIVALWIFYFIQMYTSYNLNESYNGCPNGCNCRNCRNKCSDCPCNREGFVSNLRAGFRNAKRDYETFISDYDPSNITHKFKKWNMM